MTPTKQLYPVATAQAQPIEVLPDPLIAQCKNGAMALRQTALNSGYAQDQLAERIGKPREVLSRACNGRGGLDIETLIKLMQESGSAYLLQYMAYRMGGEFRFLTPDEIELRDIDRRKAELMARRNTFEPQKMLAHDHAA
jgi:transcriptional regulator with XRE-family HTH domain